MIPTYLINLDGSAARLAESKRQLDAAGLPFIRVPAYDGRGVAPTDIPDYDEAGALSYMGRSMNGGELGCYFSHLECARQFLTTDAPYGIVLEDDMQIGADVPQTIQAMMTWVQDQDLDWDLINIGAVKGKIYTPLNTFGNTTLIHAHYFPMTTTGLIWSRKGAEKFVSEHSKITEPVDNFFRKWLSHTNTGLSVIPPLTPPRGEVSDITAAGSERKLIGRTKTYGLLKQRRLWTDKLRALKHKYF